MKCVKKMALLFISCLTFSQLTTHCFFPGDGYGYPSGALSGAAIGGLAGGRKGAAIGLGVGAFTDIASSAARDDRYYRDRYYNSRYNDDRYRRSYRPSNSSRSLRQRNQDLANENQALQQELEAMRSGQGR